MNPCAIAFVAVQLCGPLAALVGKPGGDVWRPVADRGGFVQHSATVMHQQPGRGSTLDKFVVRLTWSANIHKPSRRGTRSSSHRRIQLDWPTSRWTRRQKECSFNVGLE